VRWLVSEYMTQPIAISNSMSASKSRTISYITASSTRMEHLTKKGCVCQTAHICGTTDVQIIPKNLLIYKTNQIQGNLISVSILLVEKSATLNKSILLQKSKIFKWILKWKIIAGK
jgi:hypothetical protein